MEDITSYWTLKLAPTKYCDDVYHVGSQTALCYLINSTDGIILLDTGIPKTLYQILLNIKELGFDYRDIKHIIHSHGHIDHIGGTRALVELTGAKTYIGKGDEDTVSGRDGLPFSLRDDFIKSIEKVYNAPVELHIGNHLGDNKHNEKTTHLGRKRILYLTVLLGNGSWI